MKFFHDEGVVLKKYDTGEKDEVVILLTKHSGKMAFVARGSRSPKSRKAGALQIFNTVAFQATQSRVKLPYLEQVKSLKPRSFAIVEKSQNLDEFYRASEILKLTNYFLQEHQIVQSVYEDLCQALDLIREPLVAYIYHVRLLTDLGFASDWSHCSHCHVKLDLQLPICFHAENLGFAHRSCCLGLGDKVNLLIADDVVRVLSYWQHHGVLVGVMVKLDQDVRAELESILARMSVER